MLQALGISETAEAVYVALAPLEVASLEDLDALTGLGTNEIERQLDELLRLGLVIERTPRRWAPLSLIDGVSAIRGLRQAELEATSIAAESFENYILATRAKPEATIEVMIGREAIVTARNELCDSARREICTFDKPPYVQSRPNPSIESLREESPEWQALERGVRLRCVYHPGFDDDRLRELGLFAAAGEQSRTAPVPMKMFVFDRHTALIPSMSSYGENQELRASIVRHPQLTEALQWLFEGVWDTAVPVIRQSNSDNDPRRQMLTSLMMTGSTDSAIATQLGINVRSVRRWISELMDELGVTTRLQLGAALVRADSFRNQDF